MISTFGTSLPLAARAAVTVRRSEAGVELFVWLAVAFGAIAILCGGLYFAHRWFHHHRHHSHAALFRGLCEAHGLNRASRRLLAQVGRCCRVSPPARLFVEPQWLDSVNLSGALQTRAEEIGAMRARLFSLAASKSP
jgi:hypothetical protein